jgi:hypothetical protein
MVARTGVDPLLRGYLRSAHIPDEDPGFSWASSHADQTPSGRSRERLTPRSDHRRKRTTSPSSAACSVSTNGVDARVSSSRWARRVEGEAVVFGSRAERSLGHWLVRTRVCLLGQVVRFGVFLDNVVSRARLDDALDFSDLVSAHDREEGRVSA